MKPGRHFIIDDLAKILRKPSAAPTISPAEVIANRADHHALETKPNPGAG
jgi:hypothetical protein